MPGKPQRWLEGILATANMPTRRPQINAHRESNIPGLYVIGDLAGAPVIKLAMDQGVEVIEHILQKPDARANDAQVYDVIVVGAGAAGLNAALAAQENGLRCLVLEKNKVANTIEDFPEGKWIYAEPDEVPPKGKLWLDGATKEDLIERWHQIIRDNKLDVRAGDGLKVIRRHKDGRFTLRTEQGKEYQGRRVILATGQRGNPRRLGVPGEEQERVYHRLYSPKLYHDERILVVGGGNTAVEAALTLSERNQVTLSYRGDQFYRLFKDNERKLQEAIQAGRIQPVFNSNITALGDQETTLQVVRNGQETTEKIPFGHAFVLIGSKFPADFLKSLGLKLENEWTGSAGGTAALVAATLLGLWVLGGQSSLALVQQVPGWLGGLVAAGSFAALLTIAVRGQRWSWLGVSFLAFYSLYGIKAGAGQEFWPYTGWAYDLFRFADRPLQFWYTVLYTVVMTFFGLQALKRWGLDRRDKFQIWRFSSLIGFQWIFFFLIPEFLFQWVVEYQWVGEKLAHDPAFAEQAWRAYGLVYAWPLFFYTFFYDPHQLWIIWGVVLAFGLIPLLVLWHGKRYCSWICGCGGLAETLGDRWRHLAPKGKASLRWEKMNLVVLIAAVVITVLMLGRNVVEAFQNPAEWGIYAYRIVADIWLVGILPLTLYPFLGGKVWCRYWCPLAKMMELFSRAYARLGLSRYGIRSNEKCIACAECTRNCLVGIDVMSFALKQETITNANSSCIGCGICVSVCPMDVLHFGPPRQPLVQIGNAHPA
ncbi:MAG: NAD(P)-binding domain-containing protein [Terriglobia bacterium]